MNTKWILVLLCLILFVVVNEAKKYEGKGKDVQKDKYDKSQKGKSNDAFSKSEKMDKKTKVKNSAKNSKSVESASKVKTVADQKKDSKRQKREASGAKIVSNEKPALMAKQSETKEQKKAKSKNLSKNGKSKNHEKSENATNESTNSNADKAVEESGAPAEVAPEKSVKNEKFKKVGKKQKREVNPADVSLPEINADLEAQSFQSAAEKDVQLEDNQSKKQVKKEKKKKQIEKIDSQKTPLMDVVSVVDVV